MRRLMLDNDGSNFIGELGEDIEALVAETVRECPAEVTTYLLCSAAGTCYFPTRIGCAAPGVQAAWECGYDPFGMLLRGLKAAGKETFITYRMNDVHNPTEEWNKPRIRREHPEYVVGQAEIEAGNADWLSYCLDYGRTEVRQYVLDIIAEQVALYGDIIDGFQLDWMRFPRHLAGTPDEVWEKRDLLSAFIREVRALLNRGGREILLGVRVPTTPAGCRRLGFDLAAWGRESLVDLVVCCPFLTTEWHLPIDDMKTWLGNPTIPVIGGFDMGFGRQAHIPESLRGICTSLYDAGSDGIYLFNFPCWIEYLAARPYHWLAGLGHPHAAAAKPLLLAVEHARHKMPGIDQQGQLPAALLPGGVLELALHIPPSALPARRAMLLVHSHGDIALDVNGQPAQGITYCGAKVNQRSELFLEFVDQYWDTNSRPEPANCRTFRIDPACLVPAANQLRLTNLAGHEIEIERVNLGLW